MFVSDEEIAKKTARFSSMICDGDYFNQELHDMVFRCIEYTKDTYFKNKRPLRLLIMRSCPVLFIELVLFLALYFFGFIHYILSLSLFTEDGYFKVFLFFFAIFAFISFWLIDYDEKVLKIKKHKEFIKFLCKYHENFSSTAEAELVFDNIVNIQWERVKKDVVSEEQYKQKRKEKIEMELFVQKNCKNKE